jgi:4a-hydroxytetrahydrobiopterin dehydratase
MVLNRALGDMHKLTAIQTRAALQSVPGWNRHGAAIARTFVFPDFPAAIRFVNAVARLAERAWHHPDIEVRWNQVTLTLTTHDAGGLTKKDFKLAKIFDRLG